MTAEALVIDASVMVDYAETAGQWRAAMSRRLLGAGRLDAPAFVRLETARVLRKRHLRELWLAEQRAREVEAVLIRLWPWVAIRDRVWELALNLTIADAAYVAVAEAVGGTLLTRDSRLASASGIRCQVEVV